MVIVHDRVSLRHLSNGGLLTGLTVFNNIAGLGSCRQFFLRHHGFLARVIGAKRLVLAEFDFCLLAPVHPRDRLLHRREHLMLSLYELTKIPDLEPLITWHSDLIEESDL